MTVDTSQLKPWLGELLESCPPAGSGVHSWLFRAARQLHAHLSPDQIFALLKNGSKDCGRPVKDSEVINAIKNSAPCAWRPGGQAGEPLDWQPTLTPRPAFPAPSLSDINQLVREGLRLPDLCERSPIRFDDGIHTEDIIDTLFPGNPWLCVGKSKWKFGTRRREVWRGHLSRLPLCVPNPMIARFGRNQDGELSEHTKEATGRPVYLVTEFDFSEKARDGIPDSIFAPLVRGWKRDGLEVIEACAALIQYLATGFPRLVCVCFSGGKSLHAWWRVFDLDRSEQEKFFHGAVRLGADPATWLKSQFVRIPDGLRENGVRQTAYYLNPKEAVAND